MTAPTSERDGGEGRTPLGAAVLRVFTAHGEPAGGGFLVTGRLALTCAHVLTAALGLPRGTEPDAGTRIEVDLPLLPGTGRISASITRFVPRQPSGGGDVAVLQLDVLPTGAEPVRLLETERRDVWNHPARAFGFPAERPDGVWHSCELRDRQAGGWVQADMADGNGYRVVGGFSGCPVWDDAMVGVVGMMTVAEASGPAVGYLIPTDGLLAAVPELREQVLPPSPFRGLSAFQEADAPVFHGRAAESEDLAATVAAGRWTTLVGPSGCGKTSLVQAGVLPRLRERGYCSVIMRPSAGSSPVTALAAALLPLREPAGLNGTEWDERLEKLAARLRIPGALADIVPELLRRSGGSSGLLIVVDQFEELLTRNPADIDALARVLFGDDLPDSVRVLATLRADYLDAALTHPLLAAAVRRSLQPLTPMGAGQLREAITAPIDGVPGVRYQPNLAERILADAGSDPGALPLLEFTLDMLWRQQDRGELTHAAYDALGKVSGALRAHVDEVWDQYVRSSEYNEAAARGLLTNLVRLPIGSAAATRRTALRGDLTEDEWRLAQLLAATRLLVTGRNAEDAETVELAHEALISAWSELNGLVKTNEAFLKWRESLRHDMARWEAGKRAPELLPGPAAIAGAQGREAELSEGERAYLRQGRARRRSRARRRGTAFALVIVLILAAATAGVISKRLNDDTARSAAAGRANSLAADAAALASTDPGLAAQLAIAAYRTSPTSSAVSQLYSTLDTPIDSVVDSTGNEILRTATQADGPLAAAIDLNGSLRIWNASASGALALDATVHVQNSGIALAPHRALLAAGCSTANALCLWSLADPKHPTVLSQLPLRGTSPVPSMAFNADGTLLAGASENGTTYLWSIAQVTHPQALGSLANPGPGTLDDLAAVAFSPRAELLATTIQDGETELWNLADPSHPAAEATLKTGYQAVAFSPDGSMLAAAGDLQMGLWTLQNPAKPASIDLSGGCTPESDGTLDFSTAAFSPDGSRIAFSGTDTTDPHGELCSMTLDSDNLHPGVAGSSVVSGTLIGFGTISMAYTEAGGLLTGGNDGTLRQWRWPLQESSTANLGGTGSGWALTQSGDLMAAQIGDNQNVDPLGIWDLKASGGPKLEATVTLPASLESVQFLSEDALLTVDHNGTVVLWNLDNPRNPVQVASLGTTNFLTSGGSLIEGTEVTADNAGTLVAVSGGDNRLHLWRISSTLHATEVGSIAVQDTTSDFAGILNDGRTVFVTTPTGIQWWNTTDPAHPALTAESKLKGANKGSFISIYNVFAATTDESGLSSVTASVDLFGVSQGKVTSRTVPTDTVGQTLNVSDDGHLLAATGAANDTINLWDITDPAHPREISAVATGQTDIVDISISPNDRQMIDWSSAKSTLQVWNISNPDAPVLAYTIADPSGSNTYVGNAGFVGSGSLLAVGFNASTYYYDTDPDTLAGQLCGYVSASMTPTQWQRYAPQIAYQNPCP